MNSLEIIEQHLRNMEEALQNLSRYRHVPVSDFEKDVSLIWIAEKGLEILIQNLLDIGAHLLSSEIKNDWDDYGEIIVKLGHHGIIPKEFAERIRGMAGLRNILIHEYIKVDVSRIHDLLENRLEDFVQFMRHIQGYIEKKASGE